MLFTGYLHDQIIEVQQGFDYCSNMNYTNYTNYVARIIWSKLYEL